MVKCLGPFHWHACNAAIQNDVPTVTLKKKLLLSTYKALLAIFKVSIHATNCACKFNVLFTRAIIAHVLIYKQRRLLVLKWNDCLSFYKSVNLFSNFFKLLHQFNSFLMSINVITMELIVTCFESPSSQS